jgi:hypothetical protein
VALTANTEMDDDDFDGLEDYDDEAGVASMSSTLCSHRSRPPMVTSLPAGP